MTTRNKSTVVSESLQLDLAEYGILRREATEKTSRDDPFFGMRSTYGGYETKYGTSIKAIQDSDLDIALVAPENEPFDLLVTKNFNKAVNTASKDKLRAFIRSIVDKV